MYFVRIILMSVWLLGAAHSGWCVSTGDAAATAGHVAVGVTAPVEGHGKKGLPPAAEPVFNVGRLPVTNSMLVTWVVAVGLIIFARLATREIQAVPGGAQNFWEWLLESLQDFLESIIGSELVRKTFWFFATIFIFILFTDWFGLIPGVGTIGWGAQSEHGFKVAKPLLRGGNADLNMTFAMAMVFFVCWTFWAFRANGVKGVFRHLFGPKGDATGMLKLIMIVVFFAVGFLEVVSILFRPISLSFRLYGNIFAGENMLESVAALVPSLGWLLPVPFYFLELLVGLVQALVFMLLTAVFTMLICVHEEQHEGAPH